MNGFNVQEALNGLVPAITVGDTTYTTYSDLGGIVLIACGLIVAIHIAQAVLVGALARGKGYSFIGNFFLGLFLGTFALIYEAGRPVSYERECVMQDRLALQTAKELYKVQRAREKAISQARNEGRM